MSDDSEANLIQSVTGGGQDRDESSKTSVASSVSTSDFDMSTEEYGR